MDTCFAANIGRVSYADALKLQHAFHKLCASGDIPGVLMLVEHEPVITMGVRTKPGNVLADLDSLRAQGIELVKTDRGGDVTYHGPGQLVGYPIVRIREYGGDLHGYLRSIEETVIRTLAEFGLAGVRNGPAGVWVGERKVCSIGVAVRKWTSYHGFALNVDPIMSHFGLINPCGLDSSRVTSMSDLLGAPPAMDDVRRACQRSFEEVFGVRLVPWTGDLP